MFRHRSWSDPGLFQLYSSRFFRYVKRTAEIVTEEVGLQDVEFRFAGGVDGGRGWRVDVEAMLLSLDKLLGLGWKP